MRERIRTVRRNAASLAVLGSLCVAGAAHAARAEKATVTALAQSVHVGPASVAPIVRTHALRSLDGRDLGLRSTPREVVVVNFWATWCQPCQRELPAMQKLNEEIAPRGGRVIAVSIDASRANVERYLRAHQIVLPVACDGPDGLARKLDLEAVPLTLVFDRDGAVTWASTRSDAEGLTATRDAVMRALAEPSPPDLAGDEGGPR